MAGRESCIYHPEEDEFLIIRRHFLDMFHGDVDLAALVSLFEYLTNGELAQFAKRREKGIPWIQLGMPVIEYWMMNICGKRKIQDKLAILDQAGILRSATPGCQTVKSYLLNIEGLNRMIKAGERIDPALVGKTADQVPSNPPSSQEVIGKNADQSQEVIGKNDRSKVFFADQNDPVSLLCFKEERKEEEHMSSLSSSNSENQLQPPDDSAASPTCDDSGENPIGQRYQKKNWKRQKPERPHGASDRLRELREAQYAEAETGVGLISTPVRVLADPPIQPAGLKREVVDFPTRWNQLVPERPADPGLMAPNPRSYREPVFIARFEEICQKAKELIAAGASLEFGFLLSLDKGTEQYRWQQLLAGQLEWMKPRSTVASGKKKGMTKEENDAVIAAMEKAANEARAKRENAQFGRKGD